MMRDFCQLHSKKTDLPPVESFVQKAVQKPFPRTGMLSSALQMFTFGSTFIVFSTLVFSYFKFNESLKTTKNKADFVFLPGLILTTAQKYQFWNKAGARVTGSRKFSLFQSQRGH